MNKLYIGTYDRRPFYDYDEILGEILTRYQNINSNWGWKLNVQIPSELKLEVNKKEYKVKGWFGKEKTVDESVYSLYLIFQNPLTHEDLLFWRGFIIGARAKL